MYVLPAGENIYKKCLGGSLCHPHSTSVLLSQREDADLTDINFVYITFLFTSYNDITLIFKD